MGNFFYLSLFSGNNMKQMDVIEMGSFFASDGVFDKWMTRAYRFLVLSLLWLVCSIPIVTLGASTFALFRMVKFEKDSIKEWFKEFTSYFWRSTSIWLVLLLLQLFLVFNISIVSEGAQYNLFLYCLKCFYVILLLISFLWTLTSLNFLERYPKFFSFLLYSLRLTLVHPLRFISRLIITVVSIIILFLMPISIIMLPAFFVYVDLKIQGKSNLKKDIHGVDQR